MHSNKPNITFLEYFSHNLIKFQLWAHKLIKNWFNLHTNLDTVILKKFAPWTLILVLFFNSQFYTYRGQLKQPWRVWVNDSSHKSNKNPVFHNIDEYEC